MKLQFENRAWVRDIRERNLLSRTTVVIKLGQLLAFHLEIGYNLFSETLNILLLINIHVRPCTLQVFNSKFSFLFLTFCLLLSITAILLSARTELFTQTFALIFTINFSGTKPKLKFLCNSFMSIIAISAISEFNAKNAYDRDGILL